MITLNLISPSQKEANNFQENYLLISKTIFIILIFLFLIASIFYGSEVLLQNKLTIINNNIQNLSKQTEQKDFVDLEKSIKNFNLFLNQIDKIQNEYSIWSSFLIQVSKIVSSDINFKTFNINKTTTQFRITGIAKDRNILISFQQNLENSGLFTDIQSPISNFLSKENINFELSGKFALNQNNKQ